MEPAKLIDGDPFGLHEPPTLGDFERIEQALVDGSVRGAEADRLRTMRDAETAKLAEAFKSITTLLNDHFGAVLTKMEVGPKLDDLIPEFDIAPKLVDLLPNCDLAPRLHDLMPRLDFGPQVAELLPRIDYARLADHITCPQISSLVSVPGVTSMLEGPVMTPIDFESFVDDRPAHMEELAERQLEALNAACASLEATAQAIVESDKRAEERFADTKLMKRSQTRTVVIVTHRGGVSLRRGRRHPSDATPIVGSMTEVIVPAAVQVVGVGAMASTAK